MYMYMYMYMHTGQDTLWCNSISLLEICTEQVGCLGSKYSDFEIRFKWKAVRIRMKRSQNRTFCTTVETKSDQIMYGQRPD